MKKTLITPFKNLDDPEKTTLLVERLASVSVCISCLEFLFHPRQFTDTGLSSWLLSHLAQRRLIKGLRRVLSYPALLGLLGIQLSAAIALLSGRLNHPQRAVLTGCVAVSSMGMMFRAPYIQDGADQMTILTFSALTIGNLSSSRGKKMCLWFIALQTCLAFFTAGVAKALSASWQNGSALRGVLSTKAYGHKKFAAYLKHHPLQTIWISRAIILCECCFPSIVVIRTPLLWVALAGGLFFHTLTAAVMGFNTFFLSFGATYPAIAYCNYQLTLLRRVYTRAGVELTDPQEGCKLVDVTTPPGIKHKKIPRRNSHAQESDREYNT